MNTNKRKPKSDHTPTLTIRLGDLLPKDKTNVIGGKAPIVFGIPRYPIRKDRLPLIKR